MNDFETQLGDAQATGWLPAKHRVRRLQRDVNPYCTGDELAPHSPVFFGRTQIHHRICQKLRSPSPQSVSLLGERRIGKSSLLNQIYQALACEDKLLVVKASLHGLSLKSPADFFAALHQAICQGLQLPLQENITDFADFKQFIHTQAQHYRFVIMLDEFEQLSSNHLFNADFFAHLRTLAYESKYCLGYLTASRQPLKTLCVDGGIEESSFWNIFTSYEMGLLSHSAATQLIHHPCHFSLGTDFKPDSQALLKRIGKHPALLQIALFEIWIDLKTQSPSNWKHIRRQLRDYFEQLWEVRSDAEKTVLLHILSKQTPTDKSTLEDLQLRGLVDENGQFFAEFFAEWLEQKKPKSLYEDGEQAEKKVNSVKKIYNSIRSIILDLRKDWKGSSKTQKDDEK